jgi:hypothetical protein
MNHYALHLKITSLENRVKLLQQKIQDIYCRELISIEHVIYIKDNYGVVYDIFEPNTKLGMYVNNKFIACKLNEELELDEFIH